MVVSMNTPSLMHSLPRWMCILTCMLPWSNAEQSKDGKMIYLNKSYLTVVSVEVAVNMPDNLISQPALTVTTAENYIFSACLV